MRPLLDPYDPFAGGLLGGAAPEHQNPLIDRMTMLPIGQYEDGSLTLAWPQMLVDMYEGGVRSFEQGRQLPRVDSEGYYAGTPRAEPLDAFNAASAAPMAGVAGRVSGAVPKGALGSGGSDVMRVAANDANASAPSIALNAMEKPQGIRAYHGSPHDFDKFSLDHIGKGEGNQSYGRGLYFADSEDVAKGYRDGLSKGSPGHMYEVNINAQPEQFLDWDAPLGQQSEFVKNALLPLAKEQAEYELVRRTRNHARNDAQIRQLFGKEPPPREPLPSADDLALRMWGNEIGPGNESAIREAGVPGIRYLDGASRSNGDGMRNYTVFDDSLIDIMRKYANPETAAAPSLLLNSEDGQQNPLLANEDILRRYGLLSH